jgi:hypothetical protein
VRVRVWQAHLDQPARAFAWTPDGRVLAVATERRLVLVDGASGRIRARVNLPRGVEATAVAAAPHGQRFALLGDRARVTAFAFTVRADARHPRARIVFGGAGRFSRLAWSPDGRWLAIGWPAADQLLFLSSTRVPHVRAVGAIARHFDPAAAEPAFPQLAGWSP